MTKEDIITPSIVREFLTYSEHDGLLFWNYRDEKWFANRKEYKTWNGKWAGKQGFTSTAKSGYKQGRILQKNFNAHRVIWCAHYGSWPIGQVDHINGVRSDNRISNLRLSDNQRNQMNRVSLAGSSSQYLGVSYFKRDGDWVANIKKGPTQYRLGYFKEEKEAALAYDREARKLFGEYANPNFNLDGTRRNRELS